VKPSDGNSGRIVQILLVVGLISMAVALLRVLREMVRGPLP
jgi:hypothetical protein